MRLWRWWFPRGRAVKKILLAVQDAGMVAAAAYTVDRAGDAYLRAADVRACLPGKGGDALFANGYAVLEAARACGAAVVLLGEESLALAEVDTFLARAAADGIRVFRPLGNSPQLGWVLCATDKPASVCGTWRACPKCGMKFDSTSLGRLALRLPELRRIPAHGRRRSASTICLTTGRSSSGTRGFRKPTR